MSTKYLILIGDGMADRPLAQLQGRTSLEAAHTPNLDRLARQGCLGLVKTIPDGFTPGSDVANLAVLGYPAAEFYTGRAPLEAANIGVQLQPGEVAYRCNLVALANQDGQVIMRDFSAGHIDTNSARQLIKTLDEQLGGDQVRFYAGTSYRHLMVWRNGKEQIQCTPPHDISGQQIGQYLPQGDGVDFLADLMQRSQKIMINHPANLERRRQGKLSADSIWLWGQGRAPQLPTLKQRYGLHGALISAVDLLKGIGIYLGLTVINVPGATGYLDTNYAGKAQAAIDALNDHDFVYLHLEAPDEAGHSGDLNAKIEAIEAFDQKIVAPVLQHLELRGDFHLLIMPDHATPVSIKTHSAEPVPFILYPQIPAGKSGGGYNEKEAEKTGVFVDDGCRIIHWLLGR
ncbi:MAG: cofactor-independent phosphoglycerate mutase [Candidatus Schekmanbacteria bacterium]|nr:cofactor-independent phosphoglycerate mutase [Candidatus Schekmanbacteria bacterium]